MSQESGHTRTTEETSEPKSTQTRTISPEKPVSGDDGERHRRRLRDGTTKKKHSREPGYASFFPVGERNPGHEKSLCTKRVATVQPKSRAPPNQSVKSPHRASVPRKSSTSPEKVPV